MTGNLTGRPPMTFLRDARRPPLFAGLVVFWNAVLLAGIASQLTLPVGARSGSDALTVVTFFSGNVAEVLLVAAAGALLVNGRLPLRLAGSAVFIAHFFANFVQLASLFLIGRYLPRVAVENVRHIGLLIGPKRALAIALASAAALSVPLLVERARGRARPRAAGALAFGLLLLSAGAAVLPRILPGSVRAARAGLYEGNGIPDASPFRALVEVLRGGGGRAQVHLGEAEAAAALRDGLSISLRSPYPLLKGRIYEGEPPFPTRPGAAAHPDVLVFFTEGLSARLTGPYGAPFPGITPNLDRFAADPRTMVVTNYYNHTAATYRGIQGQLCSLFPLDGEPEAWNGDPGTASGRSYYSLARYFRDEGYETVFLDTHRRNAATVDRLAARMGFETVLASDELAPRYLGGAEPLRDDALSDHQLLDALVGFLKEREGKGTAKKPLFLCLYNIETHAFQDVAKDGPKYGDASSRTLNTVHSFDDAFGRFLRYFLASSYAGEAVVVFTADHCHYPTKAYLDAIRPVMADLPQVFVDAIPLVVYSPDQRLPETFDADYRTSLDFAPSLVHLLGLPQRPNPFLGRSIFSPRPEGAPERGIAYIDPDLYLVDRTGVARRGHEGSDPREFWRVQRLMRYLTGLEESDRIWPRTALASAAAAPSGP